MQGALDDYSDAGVADAGTAWLAQSSWSIDGDNMDHAPAQIAERVKAADTFVHLQDLSESDVLMAADYAAMKQALPRPRRNLDSRPHCIIWTQQTHLPPKRAH